MKSVTSLMSQAELALKQSHNAALRQLSVEETDLDIVIIGRVPTYYLKQMAQETIMPVLDGRKLVNHVEVAR